MSGYSGFSSRIKKCQKMLSMFFAAPVVSVVFMDQDGEPIWEEGVKYNETGVLAVPQPVSLDEWEGYCLKQ
jgi:hypothetical protein